MLLEKFILMTSVSPSSLEIAHNQNYKKPHR